MTSHSEFIHRIYVYCDGAWRNDRSAVGFVIFDQDYRERERFGSVVDASSCNRAEYHALIEALDVGASHTRKEACCFLDSEVVRKQMVGEYRLRKEGLRRLYHRVKDLERPFERATYCGVGRNDQRHRIAHQLAQDAMNGRIRRAGAMALNHRDGRAGPTNPDARQ